MNTIIGRMCYLWHGNGEGSPPPYPLLSLYPSITMNLWTNGDVTSLARDDVIGPIMTTVATFPIRSFKLPPIEFDFLFISLENELKFHYWG